MTKQQYDKSIQTRELQLPGFWAKATHFSLPAFLLFIAATLTVVYLSLVFQNINSNDVLWMAVGASVLCLFFFWVQKQRLTFQVIQTNLNISTVKRAIDEVARVLEWKGEFTSENIYEAKTRPGFFSGSWGEQITILVFGDEVFVNSICDPGQRSSVVSFGRNRENEDTLIKCIKDTEKLNPVVS